MTEMTPDQRIAWATRRLHQAAMNIAAGVDVADSLANDPEFAADRSDRANRLRAEMAAADLQHYREASAELDAAYRNGDCDHCNASLSRCRSLDPHVCCEDCTHPTVPVHTNGSNDA